MNKQFLQDAIAEAKTIKEAAIADAKATLEENFSSQAKAMLAAKLQEMEVEDELDEVNETETVEEEINLDEIEAELTEEYLTSDDLNEAETEEEEAPAEEEAGDDEGEEGEEDVEEEINLEDMTEEELTAYIEEVVGEMVTNGEIEPGDEFEDETEDSIEFEAGDEIEGEEEEIEMVDETESNLPISLEEEITKLKSELKETKKELYLAYNTVKEQKEVTNETNLLNAKLLYTNKLFLSNKNLNETVKEKILKSFDKAKTINETKLVYETLKEGIDSRPTNKKKVNESIINKTVKSITEVRKTPKTEEILPTDSWVERNQRLAGIKQY